MTRGRHAEPMSYAQFSISLPSGINKRMRDQARRKEMTLSGYIAEALRRVLPDDEREERFDRAAEVHARNQRRKKR